MILDRLENSNSYHGLSGSLAAAFAWLRGCDYQSLAVGRTELSGTDIFVLRQHYLTSAPADRRFEAHRKYADIHLVCAGSERMLYAPARAMSPTQAFDVEQDFGLYAEPESPCGLHVDAGCFVVFFPGEAHKPGCLVDRPAPIDKIVVKIRVDG